MYVYIIATYITSEILANIDLGGVGMLVLKHVPKIKQQHF